MQSSTSDEEGPSAQDNGNPGNESSGDSHGEDSSYERTLWVDSDRPESPADSDEDREGLPNGRDWVIWNAKKLEISRQKFNGWATLPQEILLVIVRHVVNTLQKDRGRRNQSTALALLVVCRSWYKLSAPVAYERIRLCSSRLKYFFRFVNTSQGGRLVGFRMHVRMLTLWVDSPADSISLGALARLFPNLQSLQYHVSIGMNNHPHNHHHAYPHIVAGQFATITNFGLTALELQNWTFPSSLDVIRILAALSTMRSVVLTSIACRKNSMEIPFHPKSRGRLTDIRLVSTDIRPFVFCFTWLPVTTKLSGLCISEVSTISALLMQLIGLRASFTTTRSCLLVRQSRTLDSCESMFIVKPHIA